MPLRPESFYADEKIDLKLSTNVAAIDAKARHVALADGKTVPYDRLLLATGAEPVRLPIPGAGERHVHTLRSLDDSRAIIANAKDAKRAIVIGASFIGLEARGGAARPRHRGACRRARGAADGAHPRARHGRLRARAA